MNKITIGRTLIAASLTLGAIGSTIIDNIPGPIAHMPAVDSWPPHALFHDAAMFLLLDAVSLIGLWMLFRRSWEPIVGARVATLVVAAYWTPFFYITTLYPQASLAPGSPVGLPYHLSNFAEWDSATQDTALILFGMPIHVNAIPGLIWISIALIGYWMLNNGIKEGLHDSRLST